MNGQAQPTYEELHAENIRLREDLSNVLIQFRELKRHIFGRKSEKLAIVGDGQQLLFETALPEIIDEPEVEVLSHKRAKRNGRKPLPKDLPRERVEYEPAERCCSDCGAELEKIGEQTSEELEYTPARFFVREHARIKRACPKCKNSVQSGKLPADETHLKVQDPQKSGLHTGYLWGALSPPGVYFHYSKSRAGKVAVELLGDYQGFVHTDAYAGYNPVFLPGECRRVGCWAHVRRKFIEVQKLSKRDVDAALKRIAELYKIEKQAKRLSTEQRKVLRQKKSVPLLAQLKELLDALNERTLPRHPLKKALEYTLGQWEELTVYTTNGILSMDNNPIERQIRPIAIGRKNYLFAGSHDGARRAAVLYTLINTCKMHGVNPYEYLRDVLRRVHVHPASRISELTPRGWKEKFA